MKYSISILCTLLAISVISCDKIDVTGFGVTVDTRFEESIYWNETHPERRIVVANDSYTIFSMADSHVGDTTNLNLFLQKADDGGAVAVVMVGDLTTGKAKDYDKFERVIKRDHPAALIPIAGNHDMYFGGWKEFYSRFGSSTFIFTIQTPAADDLYICLDSGNGTLGNKQLRWLENILEANRHEYRHCIVFSHLHFFGFTPAVTAYMPEESDALVRLFLKYNVNYAISGHLHRIEEGVLGKTRYVVMAPLTEKYREPGFMTLSISGQEIEYSLEKLY